MDQDGESALQLEWPNPAVSRRFRGGFGRNRRETAKKNVPSKPPLVSTPNLSTQIGTRAMTLDEVYAVQQQSVRYAAA